MLTSAPLTTAISASSKRTTTATANDDSYASTKPVLQIGVGDVGMHAIFVRWVSATNQIFCTTSAGT